MDRSRSSPPSSSDRGTTSCSWAATSRATSALAADFTTTVTTTDVQSSSTNFTNSIVFSAGCHSGYNVVDPDSLVNPLDWAQTFARKGATLIAGTGYQYGDTDFIMYSEQIYTSFARQLRLGCGPSSVGDALLHAKQAYLHDTPTLRGIDTKALLESTLFGLPMLKVDFADGRLPAPGDSRSVTASPILTGPGSDLGLKSATLNISDLGRSAHRAQPDPQGRSADRRHPGDLVQRHGRRHLQAVRAGVCRW